MNAREALVKAVEAWQSNPQVHQLTCGADSTHTELVPALTNDRFGVTLICLDCNYRQPISGRLHSILLAAYDAAHKENVDAR